MIPVRKVSIIDQVVESIKESIDSGYFQEGKKLPSEKQLCASLNVSRSTLREAFRVLETIGYVELKPGKGAFVKQLKFHNSINVRDWFRVNAPRLNDFIEVREAIETLAIKIASEKYTEEEFAELATINEEFARAVEEGDVHRIARLDEDFHQAIVRMTHNSLLININDLVAKEFEKYRSVSFKVPRNAQSALEPHQMILDSLRDRDAKRAIKSVTYHLQKAKEDMEEVIKE